MGVIDFFLDAVITGNVEEVGGRASWEVWWTRAGSSLLD